MRRRGRRAARTLARLLAIAEADDDGLGSTIRLVEATWDPDEGGLDLDFQCQLPNEDDWSLLRVHCRHVCDHRLVLRVCSPRLEKDHPLLWPFVDKGLEVYFHGRPADPAETEARLLAVHQRLSKGWLEFQRNRGAPFEEGNGLLGWAPKRLAEVYADVLREDGVKTNFLPSGLSHGDVWDMSQLPAPARTLRVLLLDEGRRSYVVAGGFEETVPATSRRTRRPRR